MKLKNIILFLLISVTSITYGQGLEDDLSILYMKANVLYDSGRFDESVRMYNRILGDDDKYALAYYMRGLAKYELGAYKGTKRDMMSFIELNGVTKEVIKIMSKTELDLGNYVAAQNYVTTALELDPYDAEQYRIAGNIHQALEDKNEACEMWYSASELGDSKSKQMLKEKCGIYMKIRKENRQRDRKEENTRRDDRSQPEAMDDDADVLIANEREDSSESDNLPAEGQIVAPPDMDAINEIEIDEELTVVLSNGLGARKVESSPDIFMISNESGRVVVDVCVNGRGKVKTAVLNRDNTSLNKPGLVSLALRKSKEFAFFPSFREEQCGQFIFMITTEE